MPSGPELTELPAGADPVTAERAVHRLWLRCLPVDAICYKAGLPAGWVRKWIERRRHALRQAGRDWKADRATRLMGVVEHVRGKLLARVDRAGRNFAVPDLRELREWCLLDAKLAGLFTPDPPSPADNMTLAEAIAEAERLGIPVPPALYQTPPLALAPPASDANEETEAEQV